MASVITRRQPGLAPLLVASSLWGLWATGEKFGLAGMAGVTLLAVTLASSTVLLWAILLRRGCHERPGHGQLALLALLGFFEPMLGYGATIVGLAHVNASEAALLGGTEAVFVVVLTALSSRRAPTLGAVAGILLGAVGVAVLGGSRGDLGLSSGSLLVLAGSLSAAIATMIAGRAVTDMDPLVVTAYQFLFGLLFTMPLLVWHWSMGDGLLTASVHPGHWLTVVLVCGLGLGIAFLLYNRALTRVSVSTAGIILNVIPVFGVATAVVFLREALNVWQFIGAALIVGGIFLFTEKDLGK
ncbi:DMT family transporter [Streptomyces sp. NPDC057654]|uniref:DMT family transporter n=1 Tax=Streptomyces sp. NPDC057654 TaxID=3346196 RepID=UPI0036A15A25